MSAPQILIVPQNDQNPISAPPIPATAVQLPTVPPPTNVQQQHALPLPSQIVKSDTNNHDPNELYRDSEGHLRKGELLACEYTPKSGKNAGIACGTRIRKNDAPNQCVDSRYYCKSHYPRAKSQAEKEKTQGSNDKIMIQPSAQKPVPQVIAQPPPVAPTPQEQKVNENTAETNNWPTDLPPEIKKRLLPYAIAKQLIELNTDPILPPDAELELPPDDVMTDEIPVTPTKGSIHLYKALGNNFIINAAYIAEQLLQNFGNKYGFYLYPDVSVRDLVESNPLVQEGLQEIADTDTLGFTKMTPLQKILSGIGSVLMAKIKPGAPTPAEIQQAKDYYQAHKLLIGSDSEKLMKNRSKK